MKTMPDMTAMFKDTMAAFPVDGTGAEDLFKSGADLNEKLGAVTLSAIEKSVAISDQMTQDALGGLSEVSKVKSSPADYLQAMNDFAAEYSRSAAERMSAFTEITRQSQADTLEIVTAAGKSFAENSASVAGSARKPAPSATRAASKK